MPTVEDIIVQRYQMTLEDFIARGPQIVPAYYGRIINAINAEDSEELQKILNLYARKVSTGDWKDYGLSINKREITFDIYERASEKPIYRISKNLNPKSKAEKFYVLDKNGNIIKRSENIDKLVNLEWTKLKLVK